MCARGRLYFGNSKYLEASIDYLRNVIDNDDIIIVGGSDETDFVWETIEGHKTLPQPDEINEYNDNCNIVKNGNYWVGFGYNGKVRFSNSNDKCIPSYPELIDLKITNQCDHGCNFCYMDSNMQGKHADINFLKKSLVDCLQMAVIPMTHVLNFQSVVVMYFCIHILKSCSVS